MSSELCLQKIAEQFNIRFNVNKYGSGHINDTYLINGDDGKYILQRINTNVFKNPYELMENIHKVTEHLKAKIIKEGGNFERETLNFISVKNGEKLYIYDKENSFRAYKFVEDSYTVDTAESYEQLYKAAKAFAKFQQRLLDFPADSLHEIIKDFHNTPSRFANLKKAIEENKANRVATVEKEIEFALAQEGWISAITDGLADNSIPLRVTHNDTKINNVLFDSKTHDAICVIDLDTVMPGSLLYDFGDALRIGGTSAAEDERDLSKVSFDINSFEAFTKGYAEEMGDFITEKEIELLPLSVKLITYECGIRFLTDYLEGDTYFKIYRPNQNLDRARTQLKLVESIASHFEEMIEIVGKYFK